jgi:hypothetical protein
MSNNKPRRGYIPLQEAYETTVRALAPAARPSDDYLLGLDDDDAISDAFQCADEAEIRAGNVFRKALVECELTPVTISDTARIFSYPAGECWRNINAGFPSLLDPFSDDISIPGFDFGEFWGVYLPAIRFRLWLKSRI